MPNPTPELRALLATLDPVRQPGVYVFTSVPPEATVPAVEPIASLREEEGLSLVLEEAQALQAGVPIHFRAAWIALRLHSDLDAVGLTAALSSALAEEAIPCNVIAGTFHDHLFVPIEQVDGALARLKQLQQAAARA